jgi:alkylation response protein AidB-like acyl-CoA dehydrogenase
MAALIRYSATSSLPHFWGVNEMSAGYVLSEEQHMLRDSVRKWVQPLDVRVARPLQADWAHFADMGWLAAGLPEEWGGLGGSALDYAIIAEELGRGLLRIPYVEVVTTTAQVLLSVAPERLPFLATGEMLTVIAHDEPDSRGDPEWTRCRAVRRGEGWSLTGTKSAVMGAPDAASIVCTAIVDGVGLTFFELAKSDIVIDSFNSIDNRSSADVHLRDVPAKPLGPLGCALPIIKRAIDHALVIESAEAVGAMTRSFELATEYLTTRRQFGQRIGDFQVLRHLLADMFIDLEQARSMVMRGAAALESDNARMREAMAAATKAFVAKAGMHVTGQSIQLHGGIGMTLEYPAGHYFNRLLAFSQRHGTADAHVNRFSALSGRQT